MIGDTVESEASAASVTVDLRAKALVKHPHGGISTICQTPLASIDL
jgi:hypothetical protein